MFYILDINKREIIKTIKTMKVTTEHSAQMAAMKEVGKPISEIVKLFSMYSRATVYRHANRKLGQPSRADRRKMNKGRPAKLTERDRRKIIRGYICSKEN